MSLLAEDQICWTVPAPSWARRKVREMASASPEKLREIKASLPCLVQYSMTFTSATMREEVERSALIKSVTDWFEGTYGIAPPMYAVWFRDTYITNTETRIEYPEGEKLSRDEASRIYLVTLDIGRWATMLVCLKKVETREVSMWDDKDDPAWKEIAVPDDWKNFEQFLDIFPRSLFDEAVQICDDLNPSVFMIRTDEDAKNFGGVSARK